MAHWGLLRHMGGGDETGKANKNASLLNLQHSSGRQTFGRQIFVWRVSY